MLLKDHLAYIVRKSKFPSYSVVNSNVNLYEIVGDADEDENDGKDDEEDEANSKNEEIGRAANSSDGFDVFMKTASMAHFNYPVIAEKFVCPDTEFEKVLVVVTLPGGAQDLKVELDDLGGLIRVKYLWPKPMYTVDDIFKVQMDSRELTPTHPLAVAFKTGLSNVRKKIDAAPESMINVYLPMKVQTSVNSWKKWGIKRDDGCQTLIAVFTGYVKEYLKKASDEIVNFV